MASMGNFMKFNLILNKITGYKTMFKIKMNNLDLNGNFIKKKGLAKGR